MDILTYINKMNRLYGNDPVPDPSVKQLAKQIPQYGSPGTYGESFFEEDMPNIQDLIREEGVKVGPQVKAPAYNTRKYFKPGGLVEPGVTHYATEYLSNEEFSSLYKKFKGTDKEFAEFLNKEGYKAKADRKFTADSVYSRRDRLGLESKGYVRPAMKDFKKEAKALGIDIKGLDDETIKRKVRDKRGGEVKKIKRLDPDFSAKERAVKKAWEKANPEKVKEAKFRSRLKSYEKFGMIQPVKNAKEELWRSLFEDGKRYKEGRRLKIVGDYGRYVPREEFLNAKILDTKTGKTITFKNLENYINPKNTGKTYAQVIKPYNQKWFINDTPGLRTEINSKLIPDWTSASKDNFFEIQHNAGRYNDPFDVSLSNESLNLKESQVRTKFEKMWNASDNLSDKKKAFRFYKENLPNEILSKPSMVERPRYFGTEVPFEKQLQAVKTKGVNLPKGTLKNAKEVANILSDSGIKCKLQEGLTCNDPRAYMKALEETKIKAAKGDKAALSKFKKVANGMRKLKGAAAFTGWGILGEIGFALPFAAMDYADGQSTARIINNASFGLFGMNEEEETISYLPEGSKGAEQIALEKSYMRHSALTDPDKSFPKGRIGMDPKRFQTAQQDVIKGSYLDLIKKVTPFMQGPRNEYFNEEAFAKAYGEVEAAKIQMADDIAKRKEERTVDTVFDYYDNYLPDIDDDN